MTTKQTSLAVHGLCASRSVETPSIRSTTLGNAVNIYGGACVYGDLEVFGQVKRAPAIPYMTPPTNGDDVLYAFTSLIEQLVNAGIMAAPEASFSN